MIRGDGMTDRRISDILRGITVIIDTREHEEGNCSNIKSWFNNNGIKYVRRCLKFGDYSFELNGESYENYVVVERKSGLTELSGNLAQNRERFENELQRAKDAGARVILMVEGGGWDNIIEHKYRTDLNERSFLASLFSFQCRYPLYVQFVPAKYAGMFIYSQFHYFLREKLKELGI